MGSKKNRRAYSAVVIGVSTGGVKALKHIAASLSPQFPLPVVVVTHISPESDDGLANLLNSLGGIPVKEGIEGDAVIAGMMYLAPPNYHLLIEKRGVLSLSVDLPVNFARPSVDILFESASDVYKEKLIGVILTGAGCDGSKGLKKIKDHGGLAVVQDPEDAEMRSMPVEATRLVEPDLLIKLQELPEILNKLAEERV